MAKWDRDRNLEQVTGLPSEYFVKTAQEQDDKERKEKERKQREQIARQQTARRQREEKVAKERKRQAATYNPVDALGMLVAPVGKFASEQVERLDAIGETVERTLFSPEEQARRSKLRADVRAGRRNPLTGETYTPADRQAQARARQQGDVAREVLSVPAKAVVSGLEGLLDITTQAALDVSINRGAKEDEYVRAAWDFGVTPKTAVGQTAASILGFINVTRAATKALGAAGKIGTSPIPAGLSRGQRLAAKGKRLLTEGLIPGAVADFILTDAESGNLSSAIKRLVPEEYHDSVIFALAADPDDNPWINRLRSTLEGGALNPVGNAIAGFIVGRKAAEAARAAGASAEESLAVGVDAITKETDRLAAADAPLVEAERIRWTEASELELNGILAREEEINARLTQIDPEAEPDLAVRLDAELQDLAAEKAELEARFYEAADPSTKLEHWETQGAVRGDTDINDVVSDQLRIDKAAEASPIGGRISKAARSRHVLTDAQIRIMNLTDSQVAFINKWKYRIDFQEIFRKTGFTRSEVLERAAKVYDDLQESIMSFDDIMDQPEILKKLIDSDGAILAPQGAFADPSGAVAMKAFIDDMTQKMYDIAFSAESLDYAQIGGFNNYDRLIDRFVAVMGVYKESSAYYGGALTSWNHKLKSVVFREGRVGTDYEEDDILTFGRVQKWAKEIKAAARRGDAQAVDQLRELTRAMVLAGGEPDKTMKYGTALLRAFGDANVNIFYNNILSGVKTQVRNLTGALRLVLDPAQIALRGITPVLTGKPMNEALIRSGLAGLNSIYGSLGEAWKVAKITFQADIPTTSSANTVVQMAETEAGIMMLNNMAKTDLERQAVGALKFWLSYSRFLNLPGKLLMSTDDFMRTVIARQRIAEKATFDALTETGYAGDREELIQTYLQKYSQYIDPQTGEIRDKGLALYADIGTFQDNPGALINGLSQAIDNIPFGLGRFIVPFLRTPANIFKYQLEYIPFTAKFSKRYTDAVAAGDQLTIAELEGRMAMGSLVMTTAFALGLTGNFTGNLPIDPAARKRWQDLGIRPRSIRVGDQWIPYNAIEPLNNIFAAAIDLAEIAKEIGAGDLGGMEIVERLSGQMTLAIAASLTEKSWFANFEALAEFIDLKQMTAESVQKTIAGFSYSFAVPGSSKVREFANTFDPYMREYNDVWDRVFRGNIPFWRNTAPIKYDVLTGKPVQNPYGGLWNSHMPFEVTPDIKDPVKDMLMAARYAWADNLKVHKGVRLDAEQRSYVQKQMHEAGLRQRLEDLMRQAWFREDMKAWKGRPFDPQGDPTTRPRFYNMIDDAFRDSRAIAMARLEDTNDKFGEAIRKQRIRTAETRLGSYGTDSGQAQDEVQQLLTY